MTETTHTVENSRPAWRRRTKYLTEPALQWRIVGLVLGTSLVLGLAFAIGIYLRFESSSAAYLMKYPELAQPIAHESSRVIKLLILTGLLIAVVFSLPMTVLVIFFTHRFTGPVRKTIKFLRAGAQNPADFFNKQLSFRHGDFFQDLAQAVNELRSALMADKSNKNS